MLLGVHISGVANISDAPAKAAALGCNTMQIFSRAPQRWRERALGASEISRFNQEKERFKIKPLSVHVSYLINLASPDPKLYASSIKAYIEDIREAEGLKADYIVTHMGSHKKTGEEAGIERFTAALNKIIKKTADSPVGILLENTAGSGSWLGYRFSHHGRIISGLEDKRRVGICLDTAHAYAAGYDLAGKNGLEAMLDEIDGAAGLSKLKLVHLNDARDSLGSRHDRHEHIGKGRIGRTGMKRIINHPKLRELPFILETPKTNERSDKANLKNVRSLRSRE
ncbi:MAG: deoxyribonuclease IV [Candidatus Omnitrophota bacterium]|nr:deoxyribonuclease IV [Candidatus Omnitrophota bacterium]MDD5655147.1 deoxyribonuclease IV [Candidatus Omnitrophota bacterium]